MNIYKNLGLFPYIEGDSLLSKPTVLTMTGVANETVPVPSTNKTKEVVTLSFKETDKRLILNKTNARTIAKLFGGETDGWLGKPIELYSEAIKAFGQMHNAVRVRKPANGAKT